MSDLGRREFLAPSSAQLPVSSYFDQAVYQRELQRLFKRGPKYLGHEVSVPETGDYHALSAEKEGRILVRSEQGIELLSNVCRHRQAIMLKGQGNTPNIVCPLHRWTYAMDGKLLGAPHFEQSPCLNLQSYPTQNWRGLLFEGPRDIAADLAAVGLGDVLNFSNYRLDRTIHHDCAYNWKSFIEVYLEDYHVAPFHPGLGQFVTCRDLQWNYGDWFSVQTVGIHDALAAPGSTVYKRWHEQVLGYNEGALPKFGAIWLTYFPGVMIEAYPNVLVISTLIPDGPRSTKNIVEFYYPEEIALFEREFVEAHQAAYMETCVEDDEIALRMDAGREALMNRGENQVGPYQSPMEDGMQHFHEFYRREMS